MASKRNRIIGGIAVVLILGSVVGFNVARENSKKVPVQTQKLNKRDLVSLVTASGEVKPKRFVNIGANVSGRIVQLLVKEGDLVKKDQVLAKIESERYEAGTRMSEAAVQSALADLDRAQADLDVSRLQLDRMKKMMADRLVSAQTYDQADAEVKMKAANVEAARRRVAQLQAQHDSNRDDLRKTTVFSPMDDVTDIRNLSLGEAAEIRVDALEGVKIQGEVTEIGSSAIVRGSAPGTAPTQSGANTGNQAKDFKVTITLKEPPKNLRPQMNATADITTAKRTSVLAAPIQAVVVRQVDAAGKPLDPEATPSPTAADSNTVVKTGKAKTDERDGVFVVASNKAAFRLVKTGILGETDVEILDGLK